METKNVWVKMEPSSTRPGWYSPKFYKSEPDKWVTRYAVTDPDEFISHMESYLSIPESLTRPEYETLCIQHGVTPISDHEFNEYAMQYGDFGMSHYHTEPDNRYHGVSMTLHQRRFFTIKRETKRQVGPIINAIIQVGPEPKIIKQGQLWEPCKCGREPVYMPLHLCDKCWPKQEVSK
jgi:hypothetical protein